MFWCFHIVEDGEYLTRLFVSIPTGGLKIPFHFVVLHRSCLISNLGYKLDTEKQLKVKFNRVNVMLEINIEL